MSFLKIGDRAAGAIKSGGTTRRAAKMVCLDLDHPDIESFVNWKVREELKVACLAEGIKHIAKDQQELAKKLGLKLDYDFNGEAYFTVSGQNSNNSVRIPNRFFKAIEEDGDWELTNRTNGKVAKTIKARELWDQIAYAAWRCADPGVQYDDTINQWHTCPQVRPDQRVQSLRHRRHPRPHARRNLAAHRPDDPSAVARRHQSRSPGNSRHRRRIPHRREGCLRTAHRRRIHAQAHRRPQNLDAHARLGRGTGSRRPTMKSACPANPPPCRKSASRRISEFFQLLGLFLSTANGDLGALHLDQCVNAPTHVDQFAQYVTDTWGERLYDDDYVNALMIDGCDQTHASERIATMRILR